MQMHEYIQRLSEKPIIFLVYSIPVDFCLLCAMKPS